MNYSIYLLHNMANGKVYIGQTSKTPEIRWKQHCKNARSGRAGHFYNAVRKYSPSLFKLKTLSLAATEETANQLETYWITQVFQSHLPENGYNSTGGGEGGIPTPETRKKMSIAKLGRVLTEEQKQKISASQVGKSKNFSAEGRKRIGCNTPKGVPLSAEHRQKISDGLRRAYQEGKQNVR